ncbi:MAG: Rne/Rng family ribonuclease [Phycisphaerae bacterium]|nr:Rne/Rng family ribonuclease [Phycisphaerae bacterium]
MTHQQMIVNYLPGDECRIAIMEDGRLEELHTERAGSVSFVGNIYVGKVINVEASIQAAFVDFGLESNGFLHVSDVHPMYFPGADEETTEQIGRKTPRRERPPIQACLKRGQEIVVQVLKEGISTKGPTLTSYLSIPGRYLVMLPDMDRVGVSRKVEDDEQRREMKAVLDELELPEGFGFIMRTAGEGKGKTDLKRDLAYLQRLWKDIERRRKAGDKPRLLYAESDLLMRALRDIWTSDISEIIIDNEAALDRASRFMKIVAPRSGTKLLHFNRTAPIFHAYGIEEQILRIHAREVPLPSGGSLVIDETEALVAIDVNSGKMRSHGDAETTAYKTNVEAVDEICRQLRLRDVGGLVLCDLIDMMQRDHRRDIENRFRDRLKKDRAATKALPISQFGIVEMTRQRQKGSLRSTHYAKCPACTGRGVLKRPDSVADDAMRDLGALLEHEKVHRVEMVVSPRVAGEMLSRKRQSLGRLEYLLKKHVEVRVSEDIPLDRVNYYAYEQNGADVDIDRLPRPKTPKDLPVWADLAADGDWSIDASREAGGHDLVEEVQEAHVAPIGDELLLSDDLEPTGDWGTGIRDDMIEEASKVGRGGRRRGGRGGRAGQRAPQPQPRPAAAPVQAPGAPSAPVGEEGRIGGKKRRRRRGRGRGRGIDGAPTMEGAAPSAPTEHPIGVAPVMDPGSPRGDSWDLPPAMNAHAAPHPPRTTADDAHDDVEALPSPSELIADPARFSQSVDRLAESMPRASGDAEAQGDGVGGKKRRRRRRRRGKGAGVEGGMPSDRPMSASPPAPNNAPANPPQRSRGGPRPSGPARPAPATAPAPVAAAKPPAPAGIKPPARALFGTRRRLKPGEAGKVKRDE